MKKSSWSKPELTILVRSRPEEAVLAGCKTRDLGTYPGTIAQNCGTIEQGNCAACQARGGT